MVRTLVTPSPIPAVAGHPILAVLLSLALGAAAVGPARSQELRGSIRMGPAFHIMMDLHDGFFGELLRTLHLRSQPRGLVDLTELGRSRDQLFIGNDFALYCREKTDEGYTPDQTFKVGRATKLWDIRIKEDVTLTSVEPRGARFESSGVPQRELEIRAGEAQKIDTSEVEAADLEFFLNELVFQYDSPSRRDGDTDNYHVILDGLHDALPDADGEAQSKFDDLQQFREYVRDARDSELLALRDFLNKKIERVESKSEGKDTGLLREYRRLRDEVFQRTEGL